MKGTEERGLSQLNRELIAARVSEGHTTLAKIIGMADKKFGVEFNSRLFLEQLVLRDDIEDTEIKFLKLAVTCAAILRFFESAVVAYAGNFYPDSSK
ncbi:hypothetical protein [Rhodoblastus sp.]|uniref:hypothetical protein n=1 Tax=Rhodoblastus sp. TaxID=1962975 RepID=UPI003F9CEE55